MAANKEAKQKTDREIARILLLAALRALIAREISEELWTRIYGYCGEKAQGLSYRVEKPLFEYMHHEHYFVMLGGTTLAMFCLKGEKPMLYALDEMMTSLDGEFAIDLVLKGGLRESAELPAMTYQVPWVFGEAKADSCEYR